MKDFIERKVEEGSISFDDNDILHCSRGFLEEFLRTALLEQKEELAEKYGDFRDTHTGLTLRFHLLPHTQHKPGDDGTASIKQ